MVNGAREMKNMMRSSRRSSPRVNPQSSPAQEYSHGGTKTGTGPHHLEALSNKGKRPASKSPSSGRLTPVFRPTSPDLRGFDTSEGPDSLQSLQIPAYGQGSFPVEYESYVPPQLPQPPYYPQSPNFRGLKIPSRPNSLRVPMRHKWLSKHSRNPLMLKKDSRDPAPPRRIRQWEKRYSSEKQGGSRSHHSTATVGGEGSSGLNRMPNVTEIQSQMRSTSIKDQNILATTDVRGSYDQISSARHAPLDPGSSSSVPALPRQLRSLGDEEWQSDKQQWTLNKEEMQRQYLDRYPASNPVSERPEELRAHLLFAQSLGHGERCTFRERKGKKHLSKTTCGREKRLTTMKITPAGIKGLKYQILGRANVISSWWLMVANGVVHVVAPLPRNIAVRRGIARSTNAG
ncbi:hypothetical protein BOTNAR_0566g00010 [Botryotinia narcissicola]|uniref:Uncharacterized protein n=1 Tax=Botryotinia narcissicola TaxID=278944 RepID=A0A4Z1HJ24_9HELO|nr:hypothetical protein BOTNAR_0566g00010 [Botryotinia narcissicola]